MYEKLIRDQTEGVVYLALKLKRWKYCQIACTTRLWEAEIMRSNANIKIVNSGIHVRATAGFTPSNLTHATMRALSSSLQLVDFLTKNVHAFEIGRYKIII
jgi:hypothetical protein